MFIVTFCAHRGFDGKFQKQRIEYARYVEVTRQPDIKGVSHDSIAVKCFREAFEYVDDAPVYIVNPNNNSGDWEHYFIRPAIDKTFIPFGK